MAPRTRGTSNGMRAGAVGSGTMLRAPNHAETPARIAKPMVPAAHRTWRRGLAASPTMCAPVRVGSPERTSAMSARASPMCRKRSRSERSRQRRIRRANRSRCRCGQGVQVRMSFEDPGQRLGRCPRAERHASREHLVQHAPECPDVRPLVRRFAPRLLGAHVGRSARMMPAMRAAEREGR